MSGLPSPWRRLDEDDAQGRAVVDGVKAALSRARERPRAYCRSDEPRRANGRVECRRGGCIKDRAQALVISKEHSRLVTKFDHILAEKVKWWEDHLGREAGYKLSKEKEATEHAQNCTKRARQQLTMANRRAGELQAQVDTLTRQLAARDAELQQKSSLVDEQSAELGTLTSRLAGLEHTAKRLAEWRERTLQARKAGKAAVAEAQKQFEADMADVQRRHEEELEQERAANALLDAEMTATTESLEVMQQQLKQLTPPAVTAEQWGKYSSGGERWQRSMHVNFLLGLFGASRWRGGDIATALKKGDLLYEVWQSPVFQELLYDELVEMMQQIERNHFNERLALHLKLFCHLSIATLNTANNFACMTYDREKDNYNRTVLRRFSGGRVLYVPRFIPPRCRWEPLYLEYKAKIDLAVDDDDGRICWVPFHEVMSRMFRFDAESLPDLSLFSKEKPFTIVMQLDGTGFGALSIAQLIFRSVYTSQSPRHCHLAGLLRGDDHHEGAGLLTQQLALPLREARASGCLPHPLMPGRSLPTRFLGSGDKMGILHINGRSQMCTCRGTDQRLALPPRRKLLGGFDSKAAPQLRARCVRPTYEQMVADAHEIVPGEAAPRACRWPGCTFAHDRATANDQYKAAKASLKVLTDSHVKEVIKARDKRRTTHLATHGNQHELKAPHVSLNMDEVRPRPAPPLCANPSTARDPHL